MWRQQDAIGFSSLSTHQAAGTAAITMVRQIICIVKADVRVPAEVFCWPRRDALLSNTRRRVVALSQMKVRIQPHCRILPVAARELDWVRDASTRGRKKT